MKTKYKIFIDDTDHYNYKYPYIPPGKSLLGIEQSKQYFLDNYFCLTAVKIKSSEIARINKQINLLKYKYFKDYEVEIKSTSLRNPNAREKSYVNKYGVNIDNLKDFIREYYSLILNEKENIELIHIIFNKAAISNHKRHTIDGDPFLKTVKVMLDRISMIDGDIEIIFDQMESQISSRKGRNGQIDNIYNKRSKFKIDFGNDYKNITSVKMKESKKENFLQLADLFGYNIYRQFVDHGLDLTKKDIYYFFNFNLKLIRRKNSQIKGVGIILIGGKLICKGLSKQITKIPTYGGF